MKVVIADDSSTARMVIRKCLQIAGLRQAEFFEAENGEQALEKLKTQTIDLLVTDLNMPKMDGRQLLKQISSTPALKELAVLVISSAGNEAVEAELSQLGAAAVLPKPVSPANIAAALQVVLGDSRRRGA